LSHIANPKSYTFGEPICDNKGNIYEEKSFVIEEIFDDKKLMDTAYYSNKYPQYEIDIVQGKRKKVPFIQARQEFINTMKKYNVNCISAYNLMFDMRALRSTTEKLFGKGKKFLPKEFESVELLCIWSFACEVIFTQKRFSKVAIDNGWISPKGNMLTSAEICHRYITGQYDFEESHTGLEDVKIEVSILARCFAQHKKHDSGILANPWRIPNNLKKEREKQQEQL
jgi:hypothetical protein